MSEVSVYGQLFVPTQLEVVKVTKGYVTLRYRDGREMHLRVGDFISLDLDLAVVPR